MTDLLLPVLISVKICLILIAYNTKQVRAMRDVIKSASDQNDVEDVKKAVGEMPNTGKQKSLEEMFDGLPKVMDNEEKQLS